MGFFLTYKKIVLAALIIGFAVFYCDKSLAQSNGGKPFSFTLRVEPFYKLRPDGKPGRVITLQLIKQLKEPVQIIVNCEGRSEVFQFPTLSADSVVVFLPEGIGVKKSCSAEIVLKAGKLQDAKRIVVEQQRHWTVFIYPHSHVDIGYTGLQEEVEKLHVRNIDVGIDLANKTQHYPEGARFIWNPEATWVVDAYLKKATDTQKRSFAAAVKKGWVQVDAGHSNMNTTTCSDEELLHFFKNSKAIEKLTGVPITTMVQMDVPGAAWGLVQAAVHNGVTGFISFPNYFDLRKVWEHQPFYWKGPDGKSKILFLQGSPYGIGYTIKGSKYGLAKLQTFSDKYDRVSTDEPLKNFIDPFIFNETAKLERAGSPYDLFAMTWSMADNCVIDADLPEAVKQWNSTYAYPKLVIAGAKEILTAYEEKYGDVIPEYSGDFTEFWTNGLGSDAAHVGKGRVAKEALVQAETLWTILHPSLVPKNKIDNAWENILLSAEHTWGYQIPTAPLAKVIEKRKAAFFSDAEKQSKALIHSLYDTSVTDEQYAVVNTLSWDRQGIVTLTPSQSKRGDRIIEQSSRMPVPSQRLSTGELIFKTNNIPALSSRMYEVVKGAAPANKQLIAAGTSLKNKFLALTLDPITGNIKSIVDVRDHHEYVEKESGLNSYHYLPGVHNSKDNIGTSTTVDSALVRIKENGPLLVSFLVTSKAEGTNWLEREVLLPADEQYITIQNRFDKISTRTKEGQHFGFAFRLPNSTARMDAPWSIITPERNQLKGANRNWMTFQRWIDVSNEVKGVTWTAIQSPLIEWGEMSGTILDGARQGWLWKKESKPSSTLYSWPLNNHWDTNFPLEQSGIMTQAYALLFHEGYDPVQANRFGTEQHRPLLAIPAKKNLMPRSFLRIDNPKVALSGLSKAEDRKGIVLRLRSFSEKEEKIKLTWIDKQPQKVQRYTDNDVPTEEVSNEITLLPFGIEQLYVTF